LKDLTTVEYKKIDANQFSWSVSRHELFVFCEKAYFCHYYGASGGFEEIAEAESRQIHLLKKMVDGKTWLQRLFSDTLSQIMLNNTGKIDSPILSSRMLKDVISTFNRQKKECIDEDWRNDHSKLNLLELYYGINKPESFFSYLRKQLQDIIQRFLSSGLTEILCDVKCLEWKRLINPESVNLNGLNVWLSPILVWGKNDNIMLLNITTNSSKMEKLQTHAALNSIFAQSRFHQSPSSTVSIFYDCFTGKIETISMDYDAISAIIVKINESAKAMLEKIYPGNYVLGMNFPVAELCKCKICRFQEYCIDTEQIVSATIPD
jgi:hypothetical protein